MAAAVEGQPDLVVLGSVPVDDPDAGRPPLLLGQPCLRQQHPGHGFGGLRLRRQHGHPDPRSAEQGPARPVGERPAASGAGPEGPHPRRRQHRLQPGRQPAHRHHRPEGREPVVRRRTAAPAGHRRPRQRAGGRDRRAGQDVRVRRAAARRQGAGDGRRAAQPGRPGLRVVDLRPRHEHLRSRRRRPAGPRLPLVLVPAARRPGDVDRRQPGQRHLEPQRVDLHPALSAQGHPAA